MSDICKDADIKPRNICSICKTVCDDRIRAGFAQGGGICAGCENFICASCKYVCETCDINDLCEHCKSDHICRWSINDDICDSCDKRMTEYKYCDTPYCESKLCLECHEDYVCNGCAFGEI